MKNYNLKYSMGIMLLIYLLISFSGCNYFNPSDPSTPTATPDSTPLPTSPSDPTETPAPTLPPSPSVHWVEADMGFASAIDLGRVDAGDGRGDDVIRVYAGESDFGNGNIWEYSYSGETWSKSSIIGDANISQIYGLAVADVGNGENVYACGYGFAEYTYQTDTWDGDEKDIQVTNGIQWTNNLTIGPGKNDSSPEIYIADWDRIVEISYNFGVWDGTEIDTSSQWVLDIIVAQGRNDGTSRLYAILGTFYGVVWEYTWNGSTWDLAECSSQATTHENFQILCAGAGRNDGIQRVYAWGASGLYEFSYNDGSGWSSVMLSNTPFDSDSNLGRLVLAEGRNDGITRLYAADKNGVGEYTFSGTWARTGLVTSREVAGITVGNGRNDSTPVNRIYATSGTHVYEYTAEID